MTPVSGDTPQSAPANASHWLLWSTGAAAVALAVTAFLLWGFIGPAYLLDMLVALCM